MSALDVPSWCRVRQGSSALLLVAPHGGARDSARPTAGALKVNDLHTADLATELAAALDAGLVANPVLDRNEVDLNRISQVSRRAPWFPALLERLIADILAHHERAEILFLHGWNVAQPKCDIGIGRALVDEAAAAPHAALLTTSVDYVTTRLATLRAACAARGIVALFGERYPARHANNVLQLFRRGPAQGPTAPRLRAWAAAGRIEAVQLELAAPLRWPGPLRGAFADALCTSFGRPAAPSARHTNRPPPPSPASPASESLQAYDPTSGIGLLARIDPAADGSQVSGRVLLFLDRARVALFTGDDAGSVTMSAGGPHVVPQADGFRLTFHGWLLCTDDGRHYVDLERALTTSHLLAAQIDLRFVRTRGDYGRIVGVLAVDGVRHVVDTVGFARPAGRPPPVAQWLSQFALHAALGNGGAVYVRHSVPGDSVVQDLDADRLTTRACAGLVVVCDGDPHTPHRIVVDDDAGGVVVEPTSRIAIVRPLGPGRRARVTLGVARVARGSAQGFGFYEYARVIA